MKRNFKLYIMLLATALFVACSTESAFCDLPDEKDQEGVVASMPELDIISGTYQNVTRSTLHYETKKMLFSWEPNDKIGVFMNESTNDEVDQQQFTAKEGTSGLRASFNIQEGIAAITGEKSYIAYRPYVERDLIDPKKYEISYSSQTTAHRVNMETYYKGNSDDYLESEKFASSHLPEKDYLVSEATTAKTDNNIFFNFKRISVITRLFLRAPAKELYDSLMLVVNGEPKFTLKGDLNLTTGAISPSLTDRSQTLTFSPAFDLTDISNDKGSDYIVTYMMLAPVDLTTATSVYIYLFGNNGGAKKYYKSTSLAKPNLTSNMLYQWSSAESPDEPIEFLEITVQDWNNEVVGNDNGNGTEGW